MKNLGFEQKKKKKRSRRASEKESNAGAKLRT